MVGLKAVLETLSKVQFFDVFEYCLVSGDVAQIRTNLDGICIQRFINLRKTKKTFDLGRKNKCRIFMIIINILLARLVSIEANFFLFRVVNTNREHSLNGIYKAPTLFLN